MKLIGLTGGIGSGKSTVAALFRTLGIPVYESDARARVLMNKHPEVRNQIIGLFGRQAYTSEDELDRAWIASQVFANPLLLKQLNAIVHPAVYTDLLYWIDEESQQSAPYTIQESAILFEENLTSRCSAIILVVAQEDIRINRVLKRDGISREEIQQRINNQWPDAKKIPLADYVIYNDGQRSLIDQVLDIHRMLVS